MNEELIAFANSISFPYDFSLNGEIHRFGRNGSKNSGWFIGWTLFGSKKNEPFHFCIFGDWKTNERHEFKTKRAMSREDSKNVKLKQLEAIEKFKKDKEEKQKLAAIEAIKIISQMNNSIESHQYVKNKKIINSGGVGIYKNSLIIPMQNENGNILGAQRIFPDGKKLFVKGQKVSGLFHALGNIEAGSTIVLAEGYATASSINQATGYPVVVCFNCNNLVHVAKLIRKKFNSIPIIIAGDNDQWTDGNPGKTKAIEAADMSCGVALFPEFDNPKKGNTDFNDLHCLVGLDEVRNQIISERNESSSGYIPLGFNEGTHFFFSIKHRDVIKTSSFSEKFMFELMPIAHWENLYPGDRSSVDWLNAKSNLIQESRDCGLFDVMRIRGTGVWLDKKRVVINTGEKLIVNNKSVKFDEFKSWYIYVKTEKKIKDLHSKPLSKDDCSTLVSICRELAWTEKRSGIILAGWIALARVAGALPIRPHIWMTGGSGTGKSTVIDRLINPALGCESSRIYLQGGSTEAGMRQSVKSNAMPFIFDELETNQETTKERIASIIELLRQAWSHTQGHVVKGSANGTATHYQLSFAALVSSIRIALTNDADKSRFCVLELMPHGSNASNWEKISSMLDVIDEEYGERLFSRIASMINIIFESYKIASKELALIVSQRFGQQYGMLLAGYHALVSDQPLTVDEAKILIGELSVENQKEDNEFNVDEHEALNLVIESKIKIIAEYHSYGQVENDGY